MGEKLRSTDGEKKSLAESGFRFGRNFNVVVGTVALAGAFIAPPVVAAGLTVYAGINYAQAGGFEALRRYAKNKNRKKVAKKQSKFAFI